MKRRICTVAFALLCALLVGGAPVLAADHPFVVDETGSLSEDHRDRMMRVSEDLLAQTGFALVIRTVYAAEGFAAAAPESGLLLLYTAQPMGALLYVGEDLRRWFDDALIAEFEADLLDAIESSGPSYGIMNGFGALARYLYQIGGVEVGGEIDGLLTLYPTREGGGAGRLEAASPVLVISLILLSGWGLLVSSRSRRRLREWKAQTYAGYVSTRRNEDEPGEDGHHSFQAFQTGGQLEVYLEEGDVYVESEEDENGQ